MAKRKGVKGRQRKKGASPGRRWFLTGAMMTTALSILNNSLGILDRLWSWRPAPIPTRGRISFVEFEVPSPVEITPGTARLVVVSDEIRLTESLAVQVTRAPQS